MPLALETSQSHQDASVVSLQAFDRFASRDGDCTAWFQCAGAFFLLMNSFGIINSYGTYLDLYLLTAKSNLT